MSLTTCFVDDWRAALLLLSGTVNESLFGGSEFGLEGGAGLIGASDYLQGGELRADSVRRAINIKWMIGCDTLLPILRPLS